MSERPTPRPSGQLAALLGALVLVAGAACAREADSDVAPAEAGLLGGDPLAQVEVDQRWSHLSAYNSRRSLPADPDRVDGYRTLWHDNGVKKGEGLFERGRKQGPWTWWYQSGQKRWEGAYVDDRPEGFERAWYENGQVEYEGTFREEEREGSFERWYDTGQSEVRGTYRDGRREGVFRYWTFDGVLDRERSGVYRDDVKVSDLDES